MIIKPKQICYLSEMRNLLSLVLFLVLFANNTFGSPLIYSVSKDIAADGITEIAIVDTSKYQQIRVAVKIAPKNDQTKDKVEFTRLTGKRGELTTRINELKNTLKSNYPVILTKQRELGEVTAQLEEIGKRFDEAELFVQIAAIEKGEEFQILEIDESRLDGTFLIDTPPSKLKISVKGRGKFTVYIWGQ